MGTDTQYLKAISYANYLRNNLNARSLVDNKTPVIGAGQNFQIYGVREDHGKYEEIASENLNMLKRITLVKNGGDIVSNKNSIPPVDHCKCQTIKQKLQILNEENQRIGLKLFCVKPKVQTRSYSFRKKSAARYVIDKRLLEYYQKFVPARERCFLPMMMRPRVFLDIEIKDIRPIGRIIIQLYTEINPELIMEFVRSCSRKKLLEIQFLHILPQFWIEGRIPMDRPIAIKNTKDDGLIDHREGPGIVSLKSNQLDPKAIEFTISYKPLSIMNGKQLAFGKVIRGLKILDCTQAYGTKNGKMKKDIIVSNSGVVV